MSQTDPERRSVTVETLATILPGLLPQHGDPPRQFWLDTARAILAALPQDATLAGLDVERLVAEAWAVVLAFDDDSLAAVRMGRIHALRAALAATDPEAEG